MTNNSNTLPTPLGGEVIERLRAVNGPLFDHAGIRIADPADILASHAAQAAEIERLREALRPFADAASMWSKRLSGGTLTLAGTRVGDYRRSAELLGDDPSAWETRERAAARKAPLAGERS